jgi:kinesin family protein 6/9
LDEKRGDEDPDDDESPEEQTYRRAIEQEKAVYKESFERLRILKPEIEHIRKILEKGRLNIQNQFDQWYNNLHARENLMASTNAHESFYKEASSSSSSSSVTSSNAYTTEASMSTNSRSIAKEPNDYKLHSSSSVATNSSMSTFAADSKDSSDVNDDILAFYQAKEELLKRKGGR